MLLAREKDREAVMDLGSAPDITGFFADGFQKKKRFESIT